MGFMLHVHQSFLRSLPTVASCLLHLGACDACFYPGILIMQAARAGLQPRMTENVSYVGWIILS